jgi:2-dehydropantoate 2-reductase
MGCLFAARLSKAGFHVTLLDYIEERAKQINEQGILVEGVTGEYTVKVPTVTRDLPSSPDMVLICVKSYKTRQASENIKAWLPAKAVVVTLQNGLGNVEILEQVFGKKRTLGGVTSEGATLLGPGKIKHAGQGETIIGPAGDPNGPAENLVSAFKQADFKAESVDNVTDLIWGKLIVNVGINALTAITRLKNGRLPEVPGTRLVLKEAVKEAVAVAAAKNIQIPYPDPLGRVMQVCEATAGNMASMLQDVLKEKETEVDAINGAIVREGEALGIATPVNLTLTSLVHAIQETYRERI